MTRLSDKLETAMKAGTRNIKWAITAASIWLAICEHGLDPFDCAPCTPF